jgi:hypothetical protein
VNPGNDFSSIPLGLWWALVFDNVAKREKWWALVFENLAKREK